MPDEQPWYRSSAAFGNPLASAMRLINEMLAPPEWVTEPTPEQEEARRQRDARLALTQEAEHATAPLWQQTLENLRDTAFGTVEGVIGASDELYTVPREASGRPTPMTPQRWGNLLGEAGPDLLPVLKAVPLLAAVGRLKGRAAKAGKVATEALPPAAPALADPRIVTPERSLLVPPSVRPARSGGARSLADAKLFKEELSRMKPRGGFGLDNAIVHLGDGKYRLRAAVEDRIARIYERASEFDQQSDWSDLTAALNDAFGEKEAARRFGRFWGALSPRTTVLDNTLEAVAVQEWLLGHPGETLTEEIARTLLQPVKMAGAKVGNVNKAIRGEPFNTPKVQYMGDSMVGDYTGNPLDTFATSGLGGRGKIVQGKLEMQFDNEISGLRQLMNAAEGRRARRSPHLAPDDPTQGLTDWEIYDRVSDALTDTLQKIAPDSGFNAFAQFWEGARYGTAGSNWRFADAPTEVLRKMGLGKPGAMMDRQQLQAALLRKGWKPVAIAGLFAFMDREQEDDVNEGQKEQQ